jgi:hypothetical protein
MIQKFENPTFSKLFEKASNYSHLVPINEADGDTSIKTKKKEGDAKNQAVAHKKLLGEMLVLIQYYFQMVPYSPDKDKIKTNVEGKLDAIPDDNKPSSIFKTISEAIASIAGSLTANEYGAYNGTAQEAMDAYKDALEEIGAKDEPIEGLSKAITDLAKGAKETMVKQFDSTKEAFAKAEKAKAEAAAKKPAKTGFGNFVDFKTFESVKYQVEIDEAEEHNTGFLGMGGKKTLEDMYKEFADADKSGKKGKKERRGKALFSAISDETQSLLNTLQAILGDIYTNLKDPSKIDYKSLKMRTQFGSIKGKAEALLDTLAGKDEADVVDVEAKIEELRTYQDLTEKARDKYREQYKEDITGALTKYASEEASKLILKGNALRDKLLTYNTGKEDVSAAGGSGTPSDDKKGGEPQELKDALAKANLDKDLRKGAKGNNVILLQCMLSILGYPLGAGFAGNFGPKTQAQVQAYQKAKGLLVNGKTTGVAGPKTRESIKKEYKELADKGELKVSDEVKKGLSLIK